MHGENLKLIINVIRKRIIKCVNVLLYTTLQWNTDVTFSPACQTVVELAVLKSTAVGIPANKGSYGLHSHPL